MLTISEAIEVIQNGKMIEVPYTTRKGCRGLQRMVETDEYWVKLCISEKPVKAWIDRLLEEACQEEE